MRKYLLSAILLTAIMGNAMAQDKLVSSARKLMDESAPTKENPYFDEAKINEALQIIEPALTSDLTKDKAAAWDLKAQLENRLFSNQLNKIIKEKKSDADAFGSSLNAVISAYEKCNEYDVMPNKKGKVEPKFRAANRKMLKNYRAYLANAGSLYSSAKNNKLAFKAFTDYLDFPKLGIFEGWTADSLDCGLDDHEMAYYACLTAYQDKNYEGVLKYWDQAKDYDKDVMTVYQLKTFALAEKGDTAAWVEALKDAAYKLPDHDSFSQQLMNYYSSKGQHDKALAFASDFAQKYPTNKMAPFFKGVAQFNQGKYLDAAVDFEKAYQIDPEYAEAVLNAATCYYNAANEVGANLPKNMNSPAYKAGEAKYKQLAAKAMPLYEKLKELRPDDTNLWGAKLKNIYYNLKEKDKLTKLEAEIGK